MGQTNHCPYLLGFSGEPNRSSAAGVAAGFAVSFGVDVVEGLLFIGGCAAFGAFCCGGNDGAGVGSIGLLTVEGIELLGATVREGAAGVVGAGALVVG